MKTKVFSHEFNEVFISEGVNFSDERGLFKKSIYGKKVLEMMGSVNELLCIKSNKNVIRGLHFQDPPEAISKFIMCIDCLLYTSPSPRDATLSRMPSSA